MKITHLNIHYYYKDELKTTNEIQLKFLLINIENQVKFSQNKWKKYFELMFSVIT